MTTCMVLRCSTPGSAVVTGGHHGDVHESYVCADHKQQIDDGALWDRQEGHVLMGQDMPPTLTGWKHYDGRGTKGSVLSLQTSTQEKPFEVFLTPADMKHLSMLFSSRGE